MPDLYFDPGFKSLHSIFKGMQAAAKIRIDAFLHPGTIALLVQTCTI
jgi:hypothetical protein